jgi:hypothetical protein
MARMELDITLRRPLMQLYSPFFYANDQADTFSEARAGFLQSSLMLTSYQDLFDPKYSDIGLQRPEAYWDFFYNIYRYEIYQSTLGLCLEAQRLSSSPQSSSQTVSNHTFSAFRMPTYTKASLMKSVRDLFDPMIRRISHVGSDFRDLTFLTVVFAAASSSLYNRAAILEALEDLAASCKRYLLRDSVPLVEGGDGGGLGEVEEWLRGMDLQEALVAFPRPVAGVQEMAGMEFDFDPP